MKFPGSHDIHISTYKNFYFRQDLDLCKLLKNKALVTAQFQAQHDQYFPSFSNFADVFHELLGE